MLAAVPGSHHSALGVLLGLGIGALIVYRLPLSRAGRIGVAYGEQMVTALAVTLTGGSESPLLPYLLAPAFALGLLSRPRAVLQGAVVAAVWLVTGRVQGVGQDRLQDFAITSAEWVLLGVGIGLVAAWARTLTAGDEPRVDYSQARALLEQLRSVTRGLPGGLDAHSAAEALLDAAALTSPSARSAVLAQTSPGGALVPLVVRGARRVPWRTPLTEPGPLQRAWDELQPVIDRRMADKHGRRHATSLAVFPLVSDEAAFGVVVLEAFDPDAFSPEQVDAIAAQTRQLSLRLETALLFDEVRSLATVEERDRLAREMHDGIAQELASVGYRLDALRVDASKLDDGLAASVTELRRDLTELIGNLRLSITDLKTSVSADRGLGSALSSYVHAIGSGHQLSVHLSLHESALRLPAEQEVALFRVAQAVAQNVRRNGRAANLWVTLTVDPPSARLLLEHDGPVEEHDIDDVDGVSDRLKMLGGSLHVSRQTGGRLSVEAVFEGGSDVDHDPARR